MFIIPRRTVRTSQPQQPAQVNWRNPITKGLYTATVPGQGDVLSSAALSLPTDSKLATLVAGKAVGQAVSGTTSTGIAFPKRNLEQRTELFIQFCSSRRGYGQWMVSATGSDKYSGEYSDTELGWTIHGTGWNNYVPVGGYSAPYSLIGRVAVLCFTWGKDLNGGYGRCFLDSKELTRLGGSPLTTNSDRTQSSAASSIGPAQNDNNIFLFLAWDRVLSSGEVKSVSENPWQIFEDEEDYLFIPTGNTLDTVQSTSTIAYAILNKIQCDSASAYSIKTSISSTTSCAYSVSTATNADVTVAYTLRSIIQSGNVIAYSVQNNIQQDSQLAYNIWNSFQSTVTGSYGIITKLSSDITSVFSTHNTIANNSSCNYAVMSSTAVASNTTLSYAVIGRVENGQTSAYDISYNVVNTVDVSYSLLGTALNSSNISYYIRNASLSDAFVNFALYNAVFSTATQTFNILSGVSKQYSFSYSIAQEILSDSFGSYTVWAYASATKVINYYVDGQTDVYPVRLPIILQSKLVLQYNTNTVLHKTIIFNSLF